MGRPAPDMEALHVVGPGRMGLALGYALELEGGADALTYCGRGPEPPEHPLFTSPRVRARTRYVHGVEGPAEGTTAVILAVPDDLLAEMADALAARGAPPRGTVALHLSGAFGTDPLAPLHARGYRVGALHPLHSVADPVAGAEALRGGFFSLSGEAEAVAVARRIVRRLGGRSLEVPLARRGLYHAAAVTASNHLVTLMSAARDLLVRSGVPADDAMDALLALARGTLDNVERMGAGEALTGPVRRGDVETVDLHLRLLEPEERRLYAAMARETIRLLGDGTDPERRAELIDRLEREDGRQ